MWSGDHKIHIIMQMMGYEKYHMIQWKEGRLVVLLQNHERVIELENPGADLITTIYAKFYWCPSQNDQRTWNNVFILLLWFGFYEPNNNQSLCKPLQGCEGHTINLFECSGQWPVANIQVWQIRSFHLFNKMTLLLASFSWPSCNTDKVKRILV